jgi:CRISPR-associated endonuclease Csn1
MSPERKPRNPLYYCLGIDAGCASVGWAIVLLDDNDNPYKLHSAGVRRFDAGVEGDIQRGKEESLSQKRREARGPRRNSWRRQWRLRKVFSALQAGGLLPTSDNDDHDTRHALLAELDRQLTSDLGLIKDRVTAHVFPYVLRSRALGEKLPRYAIGRALYHLAQRRGFLSNLKAGRGDEEEQGKVKKGISELQQAMDAIRAPTLGAYFATLDPEEERIRQRWTSRKMYADEFDQIWKAQAKFYPEMTDELRADIEQAIFHQRPLKSQKGLIGRCELEPFKRRAPLACLQYQEFRLLQRVNDLKLSCPDGELRPLTNAERDKLIGELNAQGDLTWATIKSGKILGLKKRPEYERPYEFNFEQGGDKKLVGNRTATKFAKVLGDAWYALDERAQTTLVDDVLRFEDEEKLVAHLCDRWKFDAEIGWQIADLHLEPGYASHSRRAIRKLLPLMREGVPYSAARKKRYPHSLKAQQAEARLRPLHEVARTLRNPTVARTMSELRKVVNAIIDEHDKPAIIRVELSRDLKKSKKERKRDSDFRDKNTDSREKSRQRLVKGEYGEKYATPGNILKIRLAEECNWQCPFTGKGIEMGTLVGDSPQFDIEHIIPFSLSLDNSYANKTLCYHDENRHGKKNRTPFQAYGSKPKWEEILERVRHFQGDASRRKLHLFQCETLPDAEEFTNRQLSDTRYLSVAVANYLASLYGGEIDEQGKRRIQVSPGRLTKFLRDTWRLNHIAGDPDDPEQKNRADHRHHAVDAFLVAVSSPKIVKAINDAAARAESRYTRELLVDVDPPWKGFVADQLQEVIDRICISSRVNRKLNGKLHEDTILSKPYEKADSKTGKPKTVHHVRKPLEKMSLDEMNSIVDPIIRKTVLEKLEKIGGEPKKAFDDRNNHPYLIAKDGRLIPIHAARIEKADSTIIVGDRPTDSQRKRGMNRSTKARYVCAGNNHHMEIVAVLDGDGKPKKWEGYIVSRFEAMRRKRDGEEIVHRNHGQGREFVFSLTNGEYVQLLYEGELLTLRVMVISGNRAEFCVHSDARPAKVEGKRISGARFFYSANNLFKAGCKKIAVDPLGRLFPAHD